MEEIKKNLLALWKGLSPQRRVSLIGSFLLSLAVLSAVVYFASKPRLTLLYGGLAPAEAGKVTDYLDQKKIQYEVTDGGRAIEVTAQDVYAARMGLAAQGIPTQSDSGVGFELFDKPTFGESDFMQRANYYRALQGELARTIKQLDEVQNARVLIVVPEDKLFGQDHQDAKASVFVQLQPGRTLSSSQLQAIRFLVANGVENLQPERVAVIDSNGRAMADTDDSSVGAAGQVTDKQRQARADLEHYLEEKAQSMLDQVLGPGQAVVRVASEIDYSALQETSEIYDPKKSAIQTETSTTETSSTQSGGGGSAASGAGVSANSGSSTPPDSSGKSNDEKKENTSNTYEVSKTVDTKSVGAGAIKRLTIALMLNERKTTSGVGSAATSKPNPRTPQEIADLENIVKAAVGFTTTDTRQDTIATSEIPFADVFDDTAPVAKKGSLADQLTGYLPYVTQGCLALLAIGILLYFKGSISGSSPKGAGEADPDSFEVLLNNYTIQANGNGYAGNGHGPVRANGTNGHAGAAILTPVELSRLIRENPDNASQAIKAWLRRN